MFDEEDFEPYVFHYPLWIKWMAILLFIGSIVAIILIPSEDPGFKIGFSALGLLCALGIYDAYHFKLEITETEITSHNVLKTKRLLINDITRIDINDNYLFFYTETNKIKLSKYVSGYYEIEEWAKEKFENDISTIKQHELEEVLTDEELGDDFIERHMKIEAVRKTAKAFNTGSWILGAVSLLITSIESIVFPIHLAFGWIIIAFVLANKGKVKIYDKDKNKEYYMPNVLSGIAVTFISLALKASLIAETYNYMTPLFLSIPIAIVVCSILLNVSGEFKAKRFKAAGTFLILGLFLFFGSIGSLIGINAFYDFSEPTKYKTTIQKKVDDAGEYSKNRIDLNAWGPLNKETSVENVYFSIYEDLKVGDTLAVNYYNGVFQFGWYEVEFSYP